MTTWHFMRSTSRTKEKFLTDGAVRFVLSALAVVVGVQTFVNTHSTIMAVLEIFCPSHTAETTILAVIWLFIVRHPQIADAAVIFSELDPTVDTIVRFGTLFSIAIPTNDLFYCKSINIVMSVFR